MSLNERTTKFHLCSLDKKLMGFIEVKGKKLFEYCTCGYHVENIEENMPKGLIISLSRTIIGELQDTGRVIPSGDSIYGLIEDDCPYCWNRLVRVLLIGGDNSLNTYFPA